MKEEIVEKISKILAGPTIDESGVVHLFILTRKLLEKEPRTDSGQFHLLYFYCDWVAHAKIDRNTEGAAILERVHQVLLKHQTSTDIDLFINELSDVLSFDTLHAQLDLFLQNYTGREMISSKDWESILRFLIKIISSCPITIESGRGGLLRAIRQRILTQPIMNGGVVQEVEIAKFPFKKFKPWATTNQEIFCLKLTLSTKTAIVVPMVRTN